MLALHNLRTKGHIELYRAVPEDVSDHLWSLAHDENFWLPDTWDGLLIDENRSRAIIPKSTAQALTVDLMRHVKTFFAEATTQEWEFLKTTLGAEDQLVRREFAPVGLGESIVDVCSLPGSILIALQDNTFLYGYGWDHHVAVQSHRQLIRLNKGDLILFRGDFIFSMAGYKANRVCVHGFLDTPHFARPVTHLPDFVTVMNDTRDADEDEEFCFVWMCPFKSTGPVSLRKHLNRYHGLFFNSTRPRLQ